MGIRHHLGRRRLDRLVSGAVAGEQGEAVTRRAAKVDANQGDIVAAIRKAGYYVFDTHKLGDGFPDILCVNKAGQVVLFEIKMPGGTLTKAEREFHASYTGALYIVRSAEQAIDYLQEEA